MANFMKIRKVSALPGVLEPSTMYMVTDADANLVNFYVSNKTGSSARHIPTKADIQSMITTALAGKDVAHVVATIAARNALAPTTVTQVVVLDATDDPSVTSGAATYIYNPATSLWYKISESESMDVVLQWANIQGRPTSSVADIDGTVADRHTHANKVVLDSLTVVDGHLNLAGAPVRAFLEEEVW